jgi:hypothetical protein
VKRGDLVQFTRVGFNYVHREVKIGIFLNETEEVVDQNHNKLRYAEIMNHDGEIVKTYNYLKINYECR